MATPINPFAGHNPTPVSGLLGKRCLVLGGGGFLGKALCLALRRSGARVHSFSRSAQPQHDDIAATTGLIEDPSALRTVLAGQDIVYHLASSALPETSNRDPAADICGSLLPVLKLLDLCREAGVRRIVFASSGGTVYGIPAQVPTPESAATMPISAYGITKLTAERYLDLYRHLYGLEYQVLRIANPYGPEQSPFRRQGVVAALLHRALRGQALEIWGSGDVVRDYIHVEDVAAAFVAATVYRGPHRIMNVGSGEGRTLTSIVADIVRVAGCATPPVVHKAARPADVPISVLDTRLIRAETGWHPRIAWEDGLADTADWQRQRYDIARDSVARVGFGVMQAVARQA